MSDFTYEIPNEKRFFQALLILLRQRGRTDIASKLSGSKCSMSHTGSFSKRRWNAFYTSVDFAFPQDKYEEVTKSINDEDKEFIRSICNELIPTKSGLDIMEVKFSISLDETVQTASAEEDLRKITAELPNKLQSEIIPEDIKTKAKEMSEVYLYTYCAENSLRAFIETIATKSYGADYLSKVKLNTAMKNKIRDRKKSQEKKKWLSARGSSDIFYLDIEDLADFIANNWDIFKQYFDTYEWIATNIKEIADCRNPVAHHCYLPEHERDVIRIDFIKILKQISETLK